MRDCPNVGVRERLPDLLHGILPASVAADVRAHVEQCADCKVELELLEQVRAVLVAPKVDTARIVARLPQYRRSSAWSRAVRSHQLQAAAAILLMAGGYFAVRGARGGGERPDTSAAVAAAPATAELAIGDTFQGLSDSDLKAMLDEIPKLEAVTPDATNEDAPTTIQRGGSGGGGAAEESQG